MKRPKIFSRARRRTLAAAGAVVLAVPALLLASMDPATAAPVGPTTHLKAVGPLDGSNGFPTWYKDSNNLSMSLCLDDTNPMCGILPDTMPDITKPVSFPDNYPDESFYMLADSLITLPGGGSAGYGAALESSFASGAPQAGQQITFGRVRIRITAPSLGTYTVTHPYGVDTFVVDTLDRRNINVTEDIGVGAPGDFTGALKSRIDPILRWDTGFVIGPDGENYIGNPAVAHKITGSSLGTNYFRIDGPNIGGAGINTISSDQFTLLGKVATNAGVSADSVSYTRASSTSSDGGYIDVFASSQPSQSIEVSGTGVATTTLQGDAKGHYFGRVGYTGSAPPPSIKVSNVSDRPRTDIDVTLTDHVNITCAVWDTATSTLTVKATSSDPGSSPVLTVRDLGTLPASGTGTFTLSEQPPSTVTVTSSKSGTATVPVTVTGGALPANKVVAQTPPTLTVQQGQPVTLDGSATQNASSYAWTQVSGPAVTIANASSSVATFTAPNAGTAATLVFRLTAQGPSGPSTADSTITVQASAPPIANAGAGQSVLAGIVVTLDASGSQGAASYAWTQTGGKAVTLTGANTAKPTFTMPVTDTPLIFQVKTVGPGGSDLATVQIALKPDVLTVTQAEYRTSKGEWRIQGTASLTTANTITVYLGSVPGTGTKIGTVVPVDALGAWSVRLAGPPVPGTVRTISVVSSRGGSLAASTLTVRS